MADLRYNVSDLFKKAFGINSPIYITGDFAKSKEANFNYFGVEVIPNTYNEWTDSEIMSWMGTPIIFPVYFNSGNYLMFKRNSGETYYQSLEELLLPPATVFSFRRSKNITKTVISGISGSVKEIFNWDDWIIDVKGIILDEPNKTAKSQFESLCMFEKVAAAIGVSSPLFNVIDVQFVCIEDFSFNIMKGHSGGAISYEMTLCSTSQELDLIL